MERGEMSTVTYNEAVFVNPRIRWKKSYHKRCDYHFLTLSFELFTARCIFTLQLKMSFCKFISQPGEQATRHIINEGRSFADKIQGPKKQEMMRLCDEADTLTNELAELCKNGMVR